MKGATASAVLIVEDESIVASDLQQTLRDLGYDAFAVAASAEEALACAAERRPDVVLMDVRIKGPLDGIETARLLQERFDVAVVYLTAHADETTIENASQTEPQGYLLKPVKAAELRSAIGLALHNHAMATERRRSEAALRKVTADLERSNRDLEQFAYVATHDLQEPLRMISSYVQLLAQRYKGRLDPDADDFIAFAVDGANRMQCLINDLLAYSRVGSRAKPLVPTDSHAALGQAIVNLAVSIREGGALVTNDELPIVLGDAGQLVQVFQNLIANAIKFHLPGRAPAVHVSARREKDGMWALRVRDNGIGIAPEFQSRLFTIFQRLHTRDEYPGTGIGLATCKRIVERHGGRVALESEPGHGSTFLFTLPDAGEVP
jgi:light-regulated signal transduction histidine kinase (bacteriophytochrome)